MSPRGCRIEPDHQAWERVAMLYETLRITMTKRFERIHKVEARNDLPTL